MCRCRYSLCPHCHRWLHHCQQQDPRVAAPHPAQATAAMHHSNNNNNHHHHQPCHHRHLDHNQQRHATRCSCTRSCAHGFERQSQVAGENTARFAQCPCSCASMCSGRPVCNSACPCGCASSASSGRHVPHAMAQRRDTEEQIERQSMPPASAPTQIVNIGCASTGSHASPPSPRERRAADTCASSTTSSPSRAASSNVAEPARSQRTPRGEHSQLRFVWPRDKPSAKDGQLPIWWCKTRWSNIFRGQGAPIFVVSKWPAGKKGMGSGRAQAQ